MKRLLPKAAATENLPSLFDFSTPDTPETAHAPNTAAPAPVTATKNASATPTQPKAPSAFDIIREKVSNLAQNLDLAGLLHMLGDWNCFSFPGYCRNYIIPAHGNIFPRRDTHTYNNDNTTQKYLYLTIKGPTDEPEITLSLAVLGDDATMKILPLTVKGVQQDGILEITDITVGAWKAQKKIENQMFFVQTADEMTAIVERCRPWILPWLREKGYQIHQYLSAPWMEILAKAGYRFADRYLSCEEQESRYHYRHYNQDIERLNRLTQPGTKPANIFKTEKCVYTNLKDNLNLNTWDIYRRMVKGQRLNKDSIKQALDRNFNEKDLEHVSSVLGIKFNDRPVFTWTSLINYLGRIDMYEAIQATEGLCLLSDYLHMCVQLNMAPRTDADSLKREHDIAARLVRQRRDEIEAERMRQNAERVKTAMPFLEYHEENFFIRPITEYDDLIDEATQQHNCVASYADRIASGQTIILTMRETRTPNRSLITVELSPDCKTIRQKYLAGNQHIRNKAMTEFLERWHRQVKQALAEQTSQKQTQTLAAA